MVNWNERYGYELILFQMYKKQTQKCMACVCVHKYPQVCVCMSMLDLHPNKPWEQGYSGRNVHTWSPNPSF